MWPPSWKGYAVVGVFVVAIVGAFFAGRETVTAGRGSILREKGFQYIAPIISCEIAADKKDFHELQFLEEKMKNAADGVKQMGRAATVAVYFRALNSGRWVGVNENASFSPASLLKVATVIAFYREAEDNPALLTKIYFWNGMDDENGMQHIKPEKVLEKGRAYSASELVRRAIVYSDNNAANLLKKEIDQKHVSQIFTDLDLPVSISAEADFMSPKSYSRLFRVLYSATYLDKQISESLLKLMTEADFKDGLVRGVPAGIQVAHKFGERSVADRATGVERPVVELHDCGIIYYPGHPYMLCVMSRGTERAQLTSVIADMSKTVYDAMSEFWKTNP